MELSPASSPKNNEYDLSEVLSKSTLIVALFIRLPELPCVFSSTAKLMLEIVMPLYGEF